MNKSTGQTRIGADVQREVSREQIAEAAALLMGGTNERRVTLLKRGNLPFEARQRGERLEADIAAAEARESSAHDETLTRVQKKLLGLRQAAFELRC